MKKIIIITTVPLSVETLIKGQAKFLSNFYQVKIVTSSSMHNAKISRYEGVEVKSINMSRKITIFRDLVSLFKILFFILKEKPDLVYTLTPKAGLLGMISSFFARVPVRIHNVVGMPLMEANGLKKILLKYVEIITYFFSTQIFSNSFGLKKFMLENLTKKDIIVIGQGSVNGVDTDFFDNNYTKKEKKDIRESLKIEEKSFVITFVGRIVKDKGINELIESFVILKKEYENLKLLLVGDYEEQLNPIEIENLNIIKTHTDIISVGFQNDIRKFLAITDIFILPSYREGLPNSLIEAGSYGIPLIGTNINGCNEVIIDNETGILVLKKDMASLKNGIELLLTNNELYDKIKSNVRVSMINRYSQKCFWGELKNEFEKNF